MIPTVSQLRQAWRTARRSAAVAPLGFRSLNFFFRAQGNDERTLSCRWHGIPFDARWKDWYAVEEVLIRHEYGFIKQLLHGSCTPVILDLGAHIGLFSLSVFHEFPEAEIYAVEASATNFTVLQHNRTLSPTYRWSTLHAAVWNADGTVLFTDMPYSTSSRVTTTPGQTVRVPSMTLAALLACTVGERTVTLGKMDIEGAELNVLPGQATLLARLQNLIVELHPQHGAIDAAVTELRKAFPYLYTISGRHAKKPLLLATRHQQSDMTIY